MLLMGQHSMSRCGAGHSVLLFNEGWGIINLPFKIFQGFTRFACHMVLKKTSKVTITSSDETNYVFSMFFKFFRSSYCLLLCLLKNKSCKNQCPKHTFQTNSILVQKSGQLCGNSEENYNGNNNNKNNKPKKSSLLTYQNLDLHSQNGKEVTKAGCRRFLKAVIYSTVAFYLYIAYPTLKLVYLAIIDSQIKLLQKT